jgi:hypothetical protein
MRQPTRVSLAFAVVFAGLAVAAYGQTIALNYGIPSNGQLSVAPLFIASGPYLSVTGTGACSGLAQRLLGSVGAAFAVVASATDR